MIELWIYFFLLCPLYLSLFPYLLRLFLVSFSFGGLRRDACRLASGVRGVDCCDLRPILFAFERVLGWIRI